MDDDHGQATWPPGSPGRQPVRQNEAGRRKIEAECELYHTRWGHQVSHKAVNEVWSSATSGV
jgi:hypothetical protein